MDFQGVSFSEIQKSKNEHQKVFEESLGFAQAGGDDKIKEGAGQVEALEANELCEENLKNELSFTFRFTMFSLTSFRFVLRQDWLKKSREEVSELKRSELPEYVEAVLIAGGLEKGADDDVIDHTVKILHGSGVTGKTLLEMTPKDLEKIALGPRKSLGKKIRELNHQVGETAGKK